MKILYISCYFYDGIQYEYLEIKLHHGNIRNQINTNSKELTFSFVHTVTEKKVEPKRGHECCSSLMTLSFVRLSSKCALLSWVCRWAISSTRAPVRRSRKWRGSTRVVTRYSTDLAPPFVSSFAPTFAPFSATFAPSFGFFSLWNVELISVFESPNSICAIRAHSSTCLESIL